MSSLIYFQTFEQYKHLSNNLFWSRHVFINSDVLFNNWLSLSAFIMIIFSVKHNLQKLIFMPENIFATSFRVTVGVTFASFNCHIFWQFSAIWILLMCEFFFVISETLVKRCLRKPKVKFYLIIIYTRLFLNK